MSEKFSDLSVTDLMVKIIRGEVEFKPVIDVREGDNHFTIAIKRQDVSAKSTTKKTR